ncbi:MAG: class I SAM-dependent methyltransferase, partial [Candidatus Limnocylindrales bacterium]
VEMASPLGACCSAVYGSPMAEFLVGDSLHPGGLESTRDLLRSSGLAPGARLLDVGCGLGASSRIAASEFGLRVDAVDASGPVIDRAMGRGRETRIRWTQASLPDLPFDESTFDAVLAECVLSTVPRELAMAEVARLLCSGGVLLLSDVEVAGERVAELLHPILGAALCVTDAWRSGEMEARLADAGFRITSRMDCSFSILALIERIEARVIMAQLVARDLGLDLAAMLGPASAAAAIADFAQPHLILDEVRSAVRDGSLRYLAITAIAGAA